MRHDDKAWAPSDSATRALSHPCPKHKSSSLAVTRAYYNVLFILSIQMMSDRHRGQLDEWLLLNHLYRHPAWNRFLHVLHGFLGRLPSVTLMILKKPHIGDLSKAIALMRKRRVGETHE